MIRWLSAAAEPRAPREEGRFRKLVALLMVLFVATAASLVSHLVRGGVQSALLTGLALLVVGSGFIGLRLKVRPYLVTAFVLTLGVLVAAVMGMGATSEGVGSLFWITLAPLIGLAVGGRRTGWIVLALSVLAIVIALIGIEQHWLTPFLALDRPFRARLIALLGVCGTAFMLVRAYEIETQASIEALRGQNEALLRAQAEADSANRAKSEFLATISHEIRTPLNGVTGMVTLLRDERDPRRLEDGLRIVQQSADMLLAVINDVLDFSKIEANQLELERVPLAPAHELKLVMELLQSRAAERNNDLELTVAPGAPEWILGDATRLRQVVMNIVSNAVKFTQGGRVSCLIKESGGRLLIEVSDTGIGMSAEVRSRLFAPFMQADASTTRRFGGTGMGLVISRRLAEAMGGTISVESEPQRGSRFTVSLPFEATTQPVAAVTLATPPPNTRSVLVVEDNFVNQVVAVRLLEKMGHRVSVANDGAQGLALLAERTFDLVLMDCHMPVMDGFEATRQLRARGDTTPVFALTAAVTTEDFDHCLAAGMTGVLSKPLRVEKLAEVLLALPSRPPAPLSRAG
jgi:signal transduction histidine kinase/CheY-like chemotaxis protein